MRFIYEKDGKRFEYHIPEGNMIVGRDRKADVAIFDHNVSRHHITVIRRDTMVIVRDLGSRNGTFVNNAKVTEATLKPGDILRLGNLSLFFDDGSPGLEVPTDLEGYLERKRLEKEKGESVTPVDGNLAPEGAAPAPPGPTQAAPPPPASGPQPPASVVPPAQFPAGFQPPPGVELVQRGEQWFLREQSTGREVPYQPPAAPATQAPETRDADVISASNLKDYAEKARDFYLSHKLPVLVTLGVLAGGLLIAAVIAVFLTPSDDDGKVMSPEIYDGFLDDGVGFFAEWIELRNNPPDKLKGKKLEARKKELYDEALKHFETIKKHRPRRQTADVMLNVARSWAEMPEDPLLRDWSSVRGYLAELVNHANVTPRAREFARERIQWINREVNSRAQAEYAQKMFNKWGTTGDIETLKSAHDEFKKLEREYPGTPAQQEKADMIPRIIEEFRTFYEKEAERRFNSGDWESAIESFEKARRYADETRLQAIDAKIAEARFQIEQSKILPRAREMKAQGRLEELLGFLADVPDHSPAYEEAQRMMRDARFEIRMKKARDYYRRADAETALKLLSEKEFYSDPEFSALRERVRKVSEALEAGNRAFEEAMDAIDQMESPEKVQGFEKARHFWNEVKNLESDPSNDFVRRAQRNLYDLTNEKIGALYYQKAQALFAEGEMKKGRDFLDLARGYDLTLGLQELEEWKDEAGRRYNRAINMAKEDKDKARELLQWILDVLRPGDSEYVEKARRALAEIRD